MAYTFEVKVWNDFEVARGLSIKVFKDGAPVGTIAPGTTDEDPWVHPFSSWGNSITLELQTEPVEGTPGKYFHSSSTTEYLVHTKTNKWELTITNPVVEPLTDSSSTTNVSMGEDQTLINNRGNKRTKKVRRKS
jgi:hypothetical protein